MVKITITSITDPSRKVEIIRMFRIVTGCDLAQAKAYFETVFDHGQCVLPAEYPEELAEQYKGDFSSLGVEVTLEQIETGILILQRNNSSWKDFDNADQTEEQGATSYTLFGKEIRFDVAAERYFDMLLMLWDAQRRASSKCVEWYDSQHNLDSLLTNGYQTVQKLIYQYAVTPLYEVLRKCDIYDITSEKFAATCCSVHYSKQVFNGLLQQQTEIEKNRAEEVEYRAERKAGRGRVVGGGFGMSGALKGMAEAAAMNAVTGIAHSAVNAIGNAGSAIGSASSKAAIYKDTQTRKKILDALVNDLTQTFLSCISLINDRKGTVIHFSFDAEKSKALFENAKTIPQKQEELLTQSLVCCPWYSALHKYIFVNYPSERPTISALAARFDLQMSDVFEDMLAKEYTDIARNNEEAARAARQVILSLMQEYKIPDSPTLNQLELDCLDRLCQGIETADENTCERILAEIQDYDAKEENKTSARKKVRHRIEEIWASEDGEIFDNLLLKTDVSSVKAIDEAIAYVKSKGRTASAKKYAAAFETFKDAKAVSAAQKYHRGKMKAMFFTAIALVILTLVFIFVFFPVAVPMGIVGVFLLVRHNKAKKAFKTLTIGGTVIHPIFEDGT